MKEQTNYDYEKYVQIAQMAKMGWWESDLKNKEYICSDFIVDLLGLESNRISFTEFHQRIREDHRLRLKNEYMSLSYLETYEQMFPIRAKDGEIWVYSKINFQKPDKEGYRNMTGFLQYIDRPIDTTNGNIDFFQVSNLLYQQTNISYSLLAFLQCDDVAQVVNKTLGDLLHQFLGDRIYIFEINRKEQRQDCTYEVTAEGISKEQEFLSNIPWDPSTWWNHQIAERRAIILNTLDDMPEEAAEYRQTLEMQDIKSLMVVPLISKEEVWGYMGIDMVRTQRSWSNVDYQCFSSLANIISICIELRKSELQAKEDRLALDNSEKILRNIYKNLPAGVELYDKDGYLVDINDKELEIFGLSDKNEALGVNLFDNPNIPSEVKERLRAKEDVNFSINYDFSKINQYVDSRRNGIINLNTKVTALYDSQNRFINYLFINIDTTETTNAYTKIQEFENLFLLIGDYAKVGFAHFNVLTRDGYAQDTWYRNLGEKEGIPMPQVIGVYAHVVPEDQAVLKNFVGEVKTGKATSLRKEVRVCRENGKYTWTSINVMVRDYRPQDGIIEMLCINYDITPLKETEQKLIIARDKAEELDRLKSAFLANMSHEIRTPLNAIVGFSSLLAETDSRSERQEYIKIVQENNELLLQLISDILDLSKIEAGTFNFVYTNVDVNETCAEIIKSMSMKVSKGVELIFEEPLPECYLYTDKNRFTQVISNFINNALKFTQQGCITLGYEQVSHQKIKFYVRDTGMGIPEEKQKSVF
ncbi:ATP-binding protein [Bacteroides xylanisolvens]